MLKKSPNNTLAGSANYPIIREYLEYSILHYKNYTSPALPISNSSISQNIPKHLSIERLETPSNHCYYMVDMTTRLCIQKPSLCFHTARQSISSLIVETRISPLFRGPTYVRDACRTYILTTSRHVQWRPIRAAELPSCSIHRRLNATRSVSKGARVRIFEGPAKVVERVVAANSEILGTCGVATECQRPGRESKQEKWWCDAHLGDGDRDRDLEYSCCLDRNLITKFKSQSWWEDGAIAGV